MNLDELILNIKNCKENLSSDRDNVVSGLLWYLEDWKKNNKKVLGGSRSLISPERLKKP
jgi:hypothetical protein